MSVNKNMRKREATNMISLGSINNDSTDDEGEASNEKIPCLSNFTNDEETSIVLDNVKLSDFENEFKELNTSTTDRNKNPLPILKLSMGPFLEPCNGLSLTETDIEELNKISIYENLLYHAYIELIDACEYANNVDTLRLFVKGFCQLVRTIENDKKHLSNLLTNLPEILPRHATLPNSKSVKTTLMKLFKTKSPTGENMEIPNELKQLFSKITTDQLMDLFSLHKLLDGFGTTANMMVSLISSAIPSVVKSMDKENPSTETILVRKVILKQPIIVGFTLEKLSRYTAISICPQDADNIKDALSNQLKKFNLLNLANAKINICKYNNCKYMELSTMKIKPDISSSNNILLIKDITLEFKIDVINIRLYPIKLFGQQEFIGFALPE